MIRRKDIVLISLATNQTGLNKTDDFDQSFSMKTN